MKMQPVPPQSNWLEDQQNLSVCDVQSKYYNTNFRFTKTNLGCISFYPISEQDPIQKHNEGS